MKTLKIIILVFTLLPLYGAARAGNPPVAKFTDTVVVNKLIDAMRYDRTKGLSAVLDPGFTFHIFTPDRCLTFGKNKFIRFYQKNKRQELAAL